MAMSPIDAVARGLEGLRPPMQIAPLAPATPTQIGPAAETKGDTGFVGMLEHALGNLNDLAQQADAMATRAATGEDVDLHEVMLAMESAGLGFQLALQVRNKLVDAYQEISRMQV